MDYRLVDPAGVLLIVNADVPVSAQAADFYCEARGLDRTNRLTWHFGTEMQWSTGWDTGEALQQAVAARIGAGVSAVICSAAVPLRWRVPRDDARGGLISRNMYVTGAGALSASLAHAAVELDVRRLGWDGFLAAHPGYQGALGTMFTWPARRGRLTEEAWRLAPPWGRLGLPVFDGAGAPLVRESLATVERIVADALANARRAHKGKRALIGLKGRADLRESLYASYRRLEAQGLDMSWMDVSGPGADGRILSPAPEYFWMLDLMSRDPPAPLIDVWKDYKQNPALTPTLGILPASRRVSGTAFRAGTLTPQIDQLFAWFDDYIENPWPIWDRQLSAQYHNSFQPAPGGMALINTSYGHQAGIDWVLRGGTVYWGTSIEPLQYGIADTRAVVDALVMGFTAAGAMRYNRPPHHLCDCVGDPLYAPFPLCSMEFISV